MIIKFRNVITAVKIALLELEKMNVIPVLIPKKIELISITYVYVYKDIMMMEVIRYANNASYNA